MNSPDLQTDQLNQLLDGVDLSMLPKSTLFPEELMLIPIAERALGECFFVAHVAVVINEKGETYLDTKMVSSSDSVGHMGIGAQSHTDGSYSLVIPDCYRFVKDGSKQPLIDAGQLRPVRFVKVVFDDHFEDGEVSADDFEEDGDEC